METKNGFGAGYAGSSKFEQHNAFAETANRFNKEAGNYAERSIDLNEQLIRNKAATFFFRMNGNAMMGAGIFNGDTLIVDRSITNVNGKVVIVLLNGEMMVRRLEKTFNKIRLIPETPNLSSIDVDTSSAEFSVWGVVVYSIHSV